MSRIAWLAFVFFAYLMFLYLIAVFLFPNKQVEMNTVPFRTMMEDWRSGGRPFVVNFLGNVVAFLPMGAVPSRLWAGRFRWRWWHAAAFGLAFSLMIEGSQLYSGRRVADVDDLILNTAGAVLGYMLLGCAAWPHRGERDCEE